MKVLIWGGGGFLAFLILYKKGIVLELILKRQKRRILKIKKEIRDLLF